MISLEHGLEQLASIRHDADSLTSRLTTDEFYRRPAADRWSAADCLAHLIRSRETYSVPIRTALAGSERSGRAPAGPYRLSWLERRFIRSMEPPVRRIRLKAPKTFEGTAIPDRTEMLAAYIHSLDAFERLMRSSEGYDISRIRISSPANRLLRLSVTAAFALLLAHERRHLWQAAAAGQIQQTYTEPITPPGSSRPV